MAIERSIYASLPLGVESDSAGFQFYSYTANFKHLVELDTANTIKSFAESGYKKHSGIEWLTQLPVDENMDNVDEASYSVIRPQTVEEANNAEIRARRFNPYAFSYKPIKVSGEDKFLFSFGKLMGIDWSGVRPGNIYLYTTVCDSVDIKKSPILYCSSPAVCCDIPRREFFPENGTPKKPELLKYLKSLDEEYDVAPLSYSAGFDDISNEDLDDFIDSGDNSEVFLSMIKSLMEYRDGNIKRRMIIADEPLNITLWIFAVCSVFPVEIVKKLSFSTYTHTPGDFDINGVFTPEMYKCFKSSTSGYDFANAKNSFAVYDFGKGYFAPEVEPGKSAFFDALENGITNNSLIDNYKDFIIQQTSYRELDSEYAKGYDLFAYMNNKLNFNITDAIGFAKKYTDNEYKKKLLVKILGNIEALTEDGNIDAVTDYMEYCCEIKITSRQKISEFFMKQFNDLFWDENIDDDTLMKKEELCEEICATSCDDLSNMFLKMNNIKDLQKAVTTTGSGYRMLYINNAVISNCAKASGRQIPDDVRIIIDITISRMIATDSAKNASFIGNYLSENFKIFDKIEMKVSLCNCVFEPLYRKKFTQCTQKVIDIAVNMYQTSSSSERALLLSCISKTVFCNDFIDNLFNAVNSETDVKVKLNQFDELAKSNEVYVKQYSDKIREIVCGIARSVSRDHTKENLINCFNSFKIIDSLTNNETKSLQEVYNIYFKMFSSVFDDDIPGKNDIENLELARKNIKRRGCEPHDKLYYIFKSLSVMKDELGSSHSCFVYKDAVSFKLVNVSDFTNLSERSHYLKQVGELCGEYWAKNNVCPNFKDLITCASKDVNKVNEELFTYTFMSALKAMKHKSECACFVIEYSIVFNYQDVLENVVSWLDKCGVKKNVVDALEKELKIKTEQRRGADRFPLKETDPVKLGEVLEIVKKHFENSSGSLLGGIKSLFKRKD